LFILVVPVVLVVLIAFDALMILLLLLVLLSPLFQCQSAVDPRTSSSFKRQNPWIEKLF